jgi:hypothetical protein
MNTNNQTMTATAAADLMRTVGALAGESMVTHVKVREAIRRAFGEQRPDKATYDALRDAFVGAYRPKALDAHRSPDGGYRDAYANLTKEARNALADKAGRSYFNDRVREVYGATQRAARTPSGETATGPTAKDSAELLRAFIDALLTKKGKESARIEADALTLHAMARNVLSLPGMARQADTVAAMYATAQVAADAAADEARKVAEAQAADEARIEALVRERLAAMAATGPVAAAMVEAAAKPTRKRRA